MNLIVTYLTNMAAYMIAALPFYLVTRWFYLRKKRRPLNLARESFIAIFVLYMVGLASQTIVPRWDAGILTDTGEFYFDVMLTNDLASVNLTPFHTIHQYIFLWSENVRDWGSVSLVNIVANMVMFSPIGFFVPLIWNKWKSFIKIALLGLAITCFIEGTQYFIGRSTDIDDVILNSIGVLMGYGCWQLTNMKIKFDRDLVRS